MTEIYESDATLDIEDYESTILEDLQLAAELGKTLLERNKELETSLKQQQNIIEDQSQEIEYLTKQTAALREVNDSRLRIYEQLEVSIQDLERTNQRLAGENNSDKKKIKSLCVSIDGLESKCEELQRTLDEMQVAERQRRRRERRRLAVKEESTLRRVISMENGLYQWYTEDDLRKDRFSDDTQRSCSFSKLSKKWKDDVNAADSMAEEEITNLLSQIQDLRRQKEREHQRVEELEEQMVSLVQENAALQEQLMVLRQREDQMKSLEEEVLALEEVRQGHLCARCLRSLDVPGDVSSLLESPDEEEMAVEEDISVHSRQDSKCPETMLGNQETLIEQSVEKSPHKSTTGNDENPYKVLVEKYEALLKMQRKSSRTRRRWKHGCKQGNIQSTLKEEDEDLNCLSLQEELKLSGDFSTNNDNLSDPASLIISNEAETILAEDTEVGNIDGTKDDYSKANDVDTMARNTPTTPTTDGGHDFSETETSSSGFSEEIRCMNKTTQTEECIVLERCETSDLAGEENSYKINANSVDGRFKNAPEYKHLFQEIFAVLKRSRSLSNEDLTEKENVENVPHKDPDLQSSPCTENRKNSEERVATPFKKVDNRVPLQNVPSNAVEITRKTVSYSAALQNARNVNKSSPDSKNGKQSANQSARKQRKSSNFKGSKVEFNINQDKFCVSEKVQKVQQWNFRPFASSASAEVAKLKQLEKSYAEVLRYGLSKQRQRLGQRK